MRSLHWIHGSSVRKAPEKVPNVYSYWLKAYCHDHQQWEFRAAWINPQVEVQLAQIGGAQLYIYHSPRGEIWTAVTNDGRWLLLNEEEIRRAEEALLADEIIHSSDVS